jgi:hypothetical protein
VTVGAAALFARIFETEICQGALHVSALQTSVNLGPRALIRSSYACAIGVTCEQTPPEQIKTILNFCSRILQRAHFANSA